MKNLLALLIAMSLLFVCNPVFAKYPAATPHLLNKGNMMSSPANPYIGDKYVAGLFYGALNLSDSDHMKSIKITSPSAFVDIPLSFIGKSVLSIGYEGMDSKRELKQGNLGEVKNTNSTFALQFSSQIGQSLKGSVKVRMEREKQEIDSGKHEESNDYSEFDIGLNYTFPNHCEVGLHVSPKGDKESKENLQAGFGCMIGKSVSLGIDYGRVKEGDHDAQNGVVLSGEYLYSQVFDIELILNLYEEEKEGELVFSYLVNSFLLRAGYMYVDVDEEHMKFTNQGFLVGVLGNF